MTTPKPDEQFKFNQLLLSWFDVHGRKDLPWQLPRDPYRVWISEIMLQQTQVQTVIPFFNRFMNKFPDIRKLAQATDDEVLSLWSGLGYYSRARNLHTTAQIVHNKYQDIFPQDLESLIKLPGIGPTTAAAILSQAYNLPTAILDGNVKRVLARFFLVPGWPEQTAVKKILWDLARACMPLTRCADYTQAIMDLGAKCCTNSNPDCMNCPLNNHCLAFKQKEQHLYPTKKIKKTLPIESVQLLVLYNKANNIYLEKRPPTGIWGGLWCLPSLNQDGCPLEFIHEHYNLAGELVEDLMHFKHRFSHFQLDIKAIKIKIRTLNNEVSESSGQWFAKEQLANLGLAKPTSLILSTF